ncbi:hypothetical protein IHN63_00400 [Deinococcus sp. 6YEL10]|uniref:hypothetical protein n=1 Tax=Deinococcus sp. 6YEL10 TaxID=2745870 RepID=UPI001E3B0C84|nr:hypothetical protein [Deinococcus sp. 6YEL10]MCD0159759.1 hypothetical protein [Deinococcus sp. 6YEL10]
MSMRDQTFEQLYSTLVTEMLDVTSALTASGENITSAYRNEAECRRNLIYAQASRDTAESRAIIDILAGYAEEGKKAPGMDLIKAMSRDRCSTHAQAVATAEAELEMATALRKACESIDERVQSKVRVIRAGSLILAAKAAQTSPSTAHSVMDELFQGLNR